eukprot:TRINITY_DN40854_c0_g1_i1.p1 TRINITY_DN40854_c0_g1~~TRINITY_DN40854_c0_g1_i1.p1  ORF type:complete len:301 (+),score=96.44 TRINITY_DN40854_c0_g1_i1:129-1031(+)
MSTAVEFLKSVKVSTFPKPEGIVYVDKSYSVRAILTKLAKFGIHSVPVLEKESEGDNCLGFVDVIDLISLLVSPEHEGKEANALTAGDLVDLSKKNPYRTVTLDQSLYDVIQILEAGVHRVAVVENKDSHLAVNIITQSAVIDFLATNLEKLGDITGKTPKELNIGYKDVVSVHADSNVLDAFKIIDFEGVSAVAVLADDESLISVISARDIQTLFPKDGAINMHYLKHTCRDFVGIVRQKNLSKTVHPAICTSEDSSLAHIIQRLNICKVHRVFITGESTKPIGVISLRDILQALIYSE